MLLDELGSDWEAEHLLEDQLENLVHSIIVQDNFSTVTNFIYDRQPDGVSKKERKAKVLNKKKKFYASSTVSEGRNLAKKVTYFYLNFILRWSYSWESRDFLAYQQQLLCNAPIIISYLFDFQDDIYPE